jgi:hypothetical protein
MGESTRRRQAPQDRVSMGHWPLPSGTVVELWLPGSRLAALRAAIARGDKPIGQFLEIAWQGSHPRHWSAEDLAEYRGRAFPEGSLRLSRLLGCAAPA